MDCLLISHKFYAPADASFLSHLVRAGLADRLCPTPIASRQNPPHPTDHPLPGSGFDDFADIIEGGFGVRRSIVVRRDR